MNSSDAEDLPPALRVLVEMRGVLLRRSLATQACRG